MAMITDFRLMALPFIVLLSACSSSTPDSAGASTDQISAESSASLNAEQSCSGYITYVAVKDATPVDTDGVTQQCFSSTDVNGKPYESCPTVLKKDSTFDFATPRAVGSKVIVCQHGGSCFDRSDLHFVTCQSEGSATSSTSNAPVTPPSEELFHATKKPERDNTYPELTITTKVNEIILNGVSINRGNCDLLYVNSMAGNDFPLNLKFGDQFKIRGLCDPSEITLNTDRGSETIEW